MRADRRILTQPREFTRTISLRLRVALLATTVVAFAVALMAAAAYSVVSRALYSEVDEQLRNRVDTMIDSYTAERLGPGALGTARVFSENLTVMLIFPDGTSTHLPPLLEVDEPEFAVVRGETESSLRTIGNHRVYAERSHGGVTIVLGQDLGPTRDILDRMAIVLFVVGGCGVVLAAAAGTAVGRTGLRPVGRLTAAAQRVARTDDLTPIPVTGDDELARLTQAFNAMLAALAESRERQARLVADAGHELRTPLTSLRTNMELLIAASRPEAPALSAEDMEGLRNDVMAQIEELSTLVGDLVDLAREDAPEPGFERIDLADVVDKCVERVRRRRGDVVIEPYTFPWFTWGDPGALNRALLNVLDNAAKWSPDGATVRVRMSLLAPRTVEICVDDDGPGIPPEERQLVFERFYRSDASRSMPGSGLGLAIVQHVMQRHGGTVSIGESPSGGARVTLRLPGESPNGAPGPT
ncbi:HAMP domain-containing histidine kinase [Hoyosella sp. YIM 151337]|uniref:sensor histidine kinase n=1 Tax=Hoyosella sp. YIM 151337 TaxID=2992742 RepID=UPI002236AF3F|nr:HAMP domain-containing sensor histidine kinase [Hoyosella sp. YIM 151337]MCW4352072.1 HAMP domain-containing histidine kinase [Hoyosella sp. YIM 151337]